MSQHAKLNPVSILLLLATLALDAGLNLRPADARQPDSEESAESVDDDEAISESDSPDDVVTASDPAASASTAKAPEDLESLRAEYFKLRDRLFQSRARASAVASALYSTRVTINLDYESARYHTVTRSTVRLDGANVFDDTEGTIASDKAIRFEGFIAPGRHEVSIRIEASGKDDERFTSVIDNSFIIQATKGKELVIKARASDQGNVAYSWLKKEVGSYKLHLDISLKSVKSGKSKSGHIQRTGELRKHEPIRKHKS